MCDCFYGGAFPLLTNDLLVASAVSGDFLPKLERKKTHGFRCESFDCDSLSERVGEERSEGRDADAS